MQNVSVVRRKKITSPVIITPQKRRSFLQRLRGHLITGIVVITPTALTIYAITYVTSTIDDLVKSMLPDALNPETYLGRDLSGVGVLVFLIGTIAVGTLARGYAGRRILDFSERKIARLPVIRPVYVGTKQIAEAVFKDSENAFIEACLIEYPTRGSWALAFISSNGSPELREITKESDIVSAFMPTAPNPITGILFFVPRREVRILRMSPEAAIKVVISAGLVTPPDPQVANTSG
jgi:uncharacterized membrane protein